MMFVKENTDNMKKRIMILANKYPNKFESTTCMFIQQLAWQFADIGYDCDVVCPISIKFKLRYIFLPFYSKETTENGHEIGIYRPHYINLGQSGKMGQKKRVLFTTKMFEWATESVIKRMDKKPDFLYAYFLCPTAVVASRLGLKYKIPAFMEHGEALYYGDRKYGNEYLSKELAGLSGVIAVSNQNKNYVVNSGIIKDEITVVYPNCFREERFFKMSKIEARKHFGWDEKMFIVGFVGSLDERKGPLRLQAAVEKVERVYFACAGSGKQKPTSERCIWAKPVLHKDLVYFYNALDAFVLPTLAEGSCTATAEAIGCGCPIISSNRAFNENLCDSENSIVIDPENVDEIAAAIKRIHSDSKLLKHMSEASIRKSENLKQSKRMRAIADFMELKAKKVTL